MLYDCVTRCCGLKCTKCNKEMEKYLFEPIYYRISNGIEILIVQHDVHDVQ